jgi:hypothetical protein
MSPRQYFPQKLVARGRFKSISTAPIAKQQHEASPITLTLHDVPIRVIGIAELQKNTLMDPVSINLDCADFHHFPKSQVRLFNTPWRSTRSHSKGGEAQCQEGGQ